MTFLCFPKFTHKEVDLVKSSGKKKSTKEVYRRLSNIRQQGVIGQVNQPVSRPNEIFYDKNPK